MTRRAVAWNTTVAAPISPRILALSFAIAGCTANDDVHPPAIGAITPAHGSPGSTVVVSGSSFCAQPDPELRPDPGGPGDRDPLACEHMGIVTFDTTPGHVLQYADTSITVEVPPLAPGEVSVLVSVAGRSSNEVSFRVE